MTNRIPKPGDVNVIQNKVWDGVKWIPMREFWALCRIWNGSDWLTKDEWIAHRLALGKNPPPNSEDKPVPFGSLQDEYDRLTRTGGGMTPEKTARIEHLKRHLDDQDVACMCYTFGWGS